jgi:hypothetical protein
MDGKDLHVEGPKELLKFWSEILKTRYFEGE